tara:strand:- start:3976 stop:4806 length:831 start_codon:yes stop_codon:yes gene_type:complete
MADFVAKVTLHPKVLFVLVEGRTDKQFFRNALKATSSQSFEIYEHNELDFPAEIARSEGGNRGRLIRFAALARVPTKTLNLIVIVDRDTDDLVGRNCENEICRYHDHNQIELYALDRQNVSAIANSFATEEIPAAVILELLHDAQLLTSVRVLRDKHVPASQLAKRKQSDWEPEGRINIREYCKKHASVRKFDNELEGYIKAIKNRSAETDFRPLVHVDDLIDSLYFGLKSRSILRKSISSDHIRSAARTALYLVENAEGQFIHEFANRLADLVQN